jgi:alpha-L-rhamnosidase
MTSFNHYALGAVASFLHTTVAGLIPLGSGYRKILISPQPGGTITNASAYTITPYGRASVSWHLSTNDQSSLMVKLEVPPNTEAVLRLSKEKDEVVGSGIYERVVNYVPEGEWPPAPYQTKFAAPPSSDTLAM